MKITMIGKSGVGKTTLIAGLYEVLGASRVEEFYITPTATDFKGSITKIGDFSKTSFRNIGYSFPAGTQQSTEWVFDLCHRDKVVCQFQWIDYRGGILEGIGDPNLMENDVAKNELLEFLAHINNSDAVILLADSVMLAKYSTPRERAFHSGAQVINELFRHFATHLPKRKLTLAIALTKADSDLIDEEWRRNNYFKLIGTGLEVFQEVVDIARYKTPDWTLGIVPIGAIGVGNTSSEFKEAPDFRSTPSVSSKITGFPSPMNIEHLMFYCLGMSLEKLRVETNKNITHHIRGIVTQRRNIEEKTSQRDDALSESTFMKELVAKLKRNQTPSELAEMYNQQLSKTKKEYDELNRRLEQEQAQLMKIEENIFPLFMASQEKVRWVI